MSVYVDNAANRAAAVSAFFEAASNKGPLTVTGKEELRAEFARQVKQVNKADAAAFVANVGSVLPEAAKAEVGDLMAKAAELASADAPRMITQGVMVRERTLAHIRGIVCDGLTAADGEKLNAAITGYMALSHMPFSQAAFNATLIAALS